MMNYGPEYGRSLPSHEALGARSTIQTFVPIERALEKAPYNPEVGVRLAKLNETQIGDQKVANVMVQIDPQKEVAAHLHEKDGEVCMALTPAILGLGDARRDDQGNYVTDQVGNVEVDNWRFYSMLPGSAIEIEEGKVHYVFNQSENTRAVVQFLIPNSHFEPDQNGVVDKKLTTPPSQSKEEISVIAESPQEIDGSESVRYG